MSTSHPDAFSAAASSGWKSPGNPEPPPVLIRAARQYDLSGMADVLALGFHSQEGMMGWMYPVWRMGIYEDLRHRLRLKSAHHACLVAIAPNLHAAPDVGLPAAETSVSAPEGYVVGTIEITAKASPLRPATAYLYLSNLAVREDYRRQGVAYQLLATCDRLALGWGFQDLYLHVLENNYKARRLYLKSGYQTRRVETNLLSCLLGHPRQLFLHKHLSKPGQNNTTD